MHTYRISFLNVKLVSVVNFFEAINVECSFFLTWIWPSSVCNRSSHCITDTFFINISLSCNAKLHTILSFIMYLKSNFGACFWKGLLSHFLVKPPCIQSYHLSTNNRKLFRVYFVVPLELEAIRNIFQFDYRIVLLLLNFYFMLVTVTLIGNSLIIVGLLF